MVNVLNIYLTLDGMFFTFGLAVVMSEISSWLSSLCGMTNISKPIDNYPTQKGAR